MGYPLEYCSATVTAVIIYSRNYIKNKLKILFFLFLASIIKVGAETQTHSLITMGEYGHHRKG